MFLFDIEMASDLEDARTREKFISLHADLHEEIGQPDRIFTAQASCRKEIADFCHTRSTLIQPARSVERFQDSPRGHVYPSINLAQWPTKLF